MRILVTGGAGFIGSHMAERLVAEGHDVVVIDSLATGQVKNVLSVSQFIRGDVSRFEDLEPAFTGGLDAVFHIAGHCSLIRSFTEPVIDLRTNAQGTINALRLCVKYHVPRLLYASSMTVYGNDAPLPTPETAGCEPVSYYGIKKHAGERYVHVTSQRGTRADYPVTYAPARSGEQRHAEADNTSARRALGWEPRVSFEEGLAETVRWATAEHERSTAVNRPVVENLA